MTVKRAMLAVGMVVAMLHGGTVSAADYPPAGAVVVVSGDLVTGGKVSVTIHNCDVGEAVRTTLGTMPAIQSRCESGVSSLAEIGNSPVRRPGVSRHDMILPDEPGTLVGEVELLGSDQTLSFFLDIRDRPLPARVVAAPSSGMPGWPFLLIAALIVALMLFLVGRRRQDYETP